MDYNRVVRDLNGMSEEAFWWPFQRILRSGKLDPSRHISLPGRTSSGCTSVATGMHSLRSREPFLPILQAFYVSILQQNVLSKLLAIHDPRTDKRVDFVGGIRGLGELEKRVNEGNAAAAFACYPVSIEQLFAIADSGEVMPPKSTWFQPKLRDGLVVYLI